MSLDDVAMFRGAKRPVQKECSLMIDKVTGMSKIITCNLLALLCHCVCVYSHVWFMYVL